MKQDINSAFAKIDLNKNSKKEANKAGGKTKEVIDTVFKLNNLTSSYTNENVIAIYKYDRNEGEKSFKPVCLVPNIKQSINSDKLPNIFLLPKKYEIEKQNPLHVDYTQPFLPIPAFPTKKKPQNDVAELLHKNQGLFNAAKAMGMILNSNNEPVGSCILLPNGRILTARHVLEGKVILNCIVIFGYFEQKVHRCYELEAIIEESKDLDYAIAQLNYTPVIEPMVFNEYLKYNSLALLHHPLGKTLQVSVNEIKFVAYAYQDSCITYHDSDFASSGGAYIDMEGNCYAIHLGYEKNKDCPNKYALTISNIKRKNPNSILFEPNTMITKNYIFLNHNEKGHENERNINREKLDIIEISKKNLANSINKAEERIIKHKRKGEFVDSSTKISQFLPDIQNKSSVNFNRKANTEHDLADYNNNQEPCKKTRYWRQKIKEVSFFDNGRSR